MADQSVLVGALKSVWTIFRFLSGLVTVVLLLRLLWRLRKGPTQAALVALFLYRTKFLEAEARLRPPRPSSPSSEVEYPPPPSASTSQIQSQRSHLVMAGDLDDHKAFLAEIEYFFGSNWWKSRRASELRVLGAKKRFWYIAFLLEDVRQLDASSITAKRHLVENVLELV